jgi:hypothetical protein
MEMNKFIEKLDDIILEQDNIKNHRLEKLVKSDVPTANLLFSFVELIKFKPKGYRTLLANNKNVVSFETLMYHHLNNETNIVTTLLLQTDQELLAIFEIILNGKFYNYFNPKVVLTNITALYPKATLLDKLKECKYKIVNPLIVTPFDWLVDNETYNIIGIQFVYGDELYDLEIDNLTKKQKESISNFNVEIKAELIEGELYNIDIIKIHSV